MLLAASILLTFIGTMASCLLVLMLIDRSRRVRRARLVRQGSGSAARAQRVMQKLDSAQDGEALRRRPTGLSGLLEARLRAAGLALSPVMAGLVIALLAALAFALAALSGLVPLLAAAPASALTGWMVFNILLDIARARRVRQFNDALPEALDIFARGMRSGQTVQGALGVVAQHARGVARDEFARCHDELKLGVTLNEALAALARRIGSPEAHFISVATSLQAETGGNLVETLDNLAELLRDRRKLRKKAAALSAETRVSAFILSSLPFVIAGVLFVMNRGYLTPLIGDPRGLVMTLVGVVCLGLGIFSMYKLSRIEA
ncbi:type II secretion system F family protein [Oceanicola sp. S124]|uniref:type II secretion system F family protein n=1 Tax=Oceanicola sp. S124 TaxID=1042378 RepID=UPI0002558614|nr:type II secretion system F family protein [Oceanicola sp. S124]